MGSITPYATAAGRRYRVRYRTPERTQTDRRGFRTKREAEQFLATVEVSKARGEYVAPSLGRITVEEWLLEWFAHRADLRPTSRERLHGIIVREIIPALGATPIAELTHSRCQAWVSEIAGRASAATTRKCAAVLSGALGAAVRDRRIAINPAHGVRLPKVVKGGRRYLSMRQVQALAAAVDNIGGGQQKGAVNGYGTLVRVLAFCGLRWGELAGLRVKDLDVQRRRLAIEHTIVEVGGVQVDSTPKNYEARTVPVPQTVIEELTALIGGRHGNEPLFRGARSGSWLRNRVYRRGWFDSAAIAIGVPGLTPHELRHTAASLAVSAGANPKALQRMLGHASAAMTLDTYADLFDADLDGVAHRLEAMAARDRVTAAPGTPTEV